MLSADQIYISEAAIDSLNAAADELQSLIGMEAEPLRQALLQWFEASIESLAEDAIYHVLRGRSDLAMGRSEFNRQIAKLEKRQPVGFHRELCH